MSSSTPEGPRDAQGAPEPQRTEDGTAATEAVPATPTTDATPSADETQRIAPAPTQQLPQTPAQSAAPAAPAAPAAQQPYQHAAPQQPAAQPQHPGAPAPQQPRYGQYAPQQHPGHQQPAAHQQPAGPQHPQQQHPHAPQQGHDPLAAFRAPVGPGTPQGPAEPQGPHGPQGPTGGPEYPAAFGAPGEPGGAPARTRTARDRIWLPVAGVGVAAAVLASLGTAALTGAFENDGSSRAASIASIGQSSNDSVPVSGSTSDNPDWQAVASAVKDSVVAITVTTSQGEAQGSGVIVDTEGHVVTNNHVVSGAQDGKVQVTLTDGRIFTADVVGTDPTTDLAVVKLQDAPDDLKPAALGASADVTVGDPVMAVGNPLGLANTVTTGIVSAVDRPVSTTEDGSNEAVVTNAIQIDAAVNPGNSGGPLFDAQGQVIGITSSIATTSSQSGSIGLGFAIPVDLADMIAGQLIEDGTAEHAFLGVGLTDNTATADGVTRAGAEVQSVTSGSPAADAGVQQGDVIVAIDGKAVGGAESLTGYVRAYASGDEVTLTLVRDGKSLDVDVTLAVRQETTSSDSGSGGSGSTDPRNMTPDELWQWFQQQQGGGQN
ncbi:MAG: trypsin-like peptidase domain-containing protein [Cellulomonas sp.]